MELPEKEGERGLKYMGKLFRKNLMIKVSVNSRLESFRT